jgi:outer membrane protein TolC
MSAHLIATLLVAAAPPCGPLDLDTAVGLAMARSDEIAIKQADVVTAHADEALARALRIVPQASATVLSGPSPEARGTFLHPSAGTDRSFTGIRPFVRVDVQAIQPLYTWGRLDAASEAASAGVEGRELVVQDTAAQVQLRVVQTFWGSVLAKRFLAIAGDVRSALDEAAQRVREALTSEDEDVSLADKFRVDLARGMLEGRAAEAQKGLDLARVALAAMLRTDAARLTLQDVPLEAPPAPVPDRVAALATAERERPDLRALDDAIRAREAQVRSEEAATKPQLFLAGQFAYSYAPNRDRQFNPWVGDWFNTLTFGVALGVREDLALMTLSANARKARAERDALRLQREGLARLVQVQIDSALAELRAAGARQGAAQAALGSGRSLFRSAGLDFAAGVIDAKSLIEAYRDYVESQIAAAQAAYDLLVSRARLAQVVGEPPRKGVQCELP